MESLRREAPNPKLQAPSSREVPRSKLQRAVLDGHHIARTLVWSLRFEASLELGVWALVLRCAPYSTENSEELFRRVPAVKTFRNPFAVALQIQSLAISGETVTPK